MGFNVVTVCDVWISQGLTRREEAVVFTLFVVWVVGVLGDLLVKGGSDAVRKGCNPLSVFARPT